MTANVNSGETAPLLGSQSQHTPGTSDDGQDCGKTGQGLSFGRAASVLPIALLSALAMAATAATQIYAYADLLCDDAQHCNDSEKRKFAGAVAVATTAANVCALFSIRGFEALSRHRNRAGLAIWIVVRSLSVGALSLGVLLRNIVVAMSSHIFEGLASDNILHFNLNAIYIQTTAQHDTSRLIGTSLALYMIGISISPSIASLLQNFRDSFLMAYGLFGAAFLYLTGLGQTLRKEGAKTHAVINSAVHAHAEHSRTRNFFSVMTSPFLFLLEDYWRLLPGLALFLYNSVQSYTFSAIMVHTSTHFAFSSRENGFLLTIVHLVASVYLFSVVFMAPYASKIWRMRESPHEINSTQANGTKYSSEALLAVVSLLFQGGSLLLFAFVKEVWQVYCTSALLALGLACPSFIKSYFVSNFPSETKPRALAALAVMETSGGLVAPVLLGSLQTLWPGRGIFFVASSIVGISSIIMTCGMFVEYQRRKHRHP